MLQAFPGVDRPLQSVIQGISTVQRPFTPVAPPSESVKTAAMAVLHASNWSYRQIGLAFGCDHKTVKQRVYPTEAFLTGCDVPKPAAHEIDADHDSSGLAEHFILFSLLENPTCSVRDIASAMSQANFPFAKAKTCVSKFINEMDVRACHAIKRPHLTERHMGNRRHFAAEIPTDVRFHLPWLFTDECSIDLNPYRKPVYRIPGIRTAEKIYQDYTKHPIHVMVWGGIARNYKSPLVLVDGTIDAGKYIRILSENRIIETLDEVYGRKGWVFQDDGASPHRAKITKAWLNERCLNLTTGSLSWPSMSPDLNVQEQMWALLRGGLNLQGCTSPEELYARAVTAWEAIPMDVVNRIIDSFPVRLLAVEALQGECLNGHRDVLKELQTGRKAVKQIQEELLGERGMISRFIESSRQFFGSFRERWEENPRYGLFVLESYEIMKLLPSATRKAVEMKKRYPRWASLASG
jgi:hypothetical protein